LLNLGNISFHHVCVIVPELDENQNAIEYMPQSMYKNEKGYPLLKYGNGPFCKFKIDKKYSGKNGIYAICVDKNLKYIGECENFLKRFNYGYGNISPKNCFKGGRPTNCRINSLILSFYKKDLKIDLYFFETPNRFKLEYEIIKKNNPEWNKTIGKPSKISLFMF